MNNQVNWRRTKTIQYFCIVVACAVIWSSCTGPHDQLIFNPPVNKAFYFSLAKYSEKAWIYQSIPHKLSDSVYLDFSLENIDRSDTTVTCKFTLQRFTWKGKFKVNYLRDSLHALSTLIVFNKFGKVLSVYDMSDMIKDIERDSATGKYLNGVIPDEISETALTDMLTRIFSVLPGKKVTTNETWITNISLTTKHPVNFSNYNVLKCRQGDTAVVDIQSNIFARPSPGDEFYIKGTQKGSAYLDIQNGIPFWYKTKSEMITKTSLYDIKDSQIFILSGRKIL